MKFVCKSYSEWISYGYCTYKSYNDWMLYDFLFVQAITTRYCLIVVNY